MPTGKIKFINLKNKFGFIVEHETGKEIYVHIKDILEPVTEGDEVEFEIKPGKKGDAAVSVRRKK